MEIKSSGWRSREERDVIVEYIVSLAVVDHKDIGSGRSVRTKAVSYTHLDVYKRQV